MPQSGGAAQQVLTHQPSKFVDRNTDAEQRGDDALSQRAGEYRIDVRAIHVAQQDVCGGVN
jgi:hypothetical protein